MTAPQLDITNESQVYRLEEPVNEPATTGLQDEWFIQYNTAAPRSSFHQIEDVYYEKLAVNFGCVAQDNIWVTLERK